MSLDKYLKPKSPSPTPDMETLPGNDGERLRQKASRYTDYAGLPASSIEAKPEPLSTEPIEPYTSDNEPDVTRISTLGPALSNAKGNRFKSIPSRKNPPLSRPAGLKASQKSGLANGPAPATGIKLVFVDETMKAEYMQMAGYLMLYHRVKLTMTAYFCFLHQQAVARQTDKNFMAELAQFVTPPDNHVAS